MNPAWILAGLGLAIAVLALGGRKVFWGRPSGWPGAGLIMLVGMSAFLLALAIILALAMFLVLNPACYPRCFPSRL